MQDKLQITLQNLPYSDALDARIRAKMEKLERNYPRLTACHVVVSEPHRHQQRHRLLTVTMKIAFPGGEVVVTRDDNEDVYVLSRDAFDAAGRELEKAMGQRSDRAARDRGVSAGPTQVMEEQNRE